MSEKNTNVFLKVANSAIAKKVAGHKSLPIIIISAIVIVVLTVIFFITGIGTASAKASEIYEAKKNEQKTAASDAFLSAVHQTVESKYHVSNDVKVNIEFTEDVSRLEVLDVFDTDYAINNDKGITIWTEIPATGVFTVDLKHAEIISDAQSGYVLVKVFKPELTSFDLGNAEIIYSKNSNLLKFINNGSTQQGVDLAHKNLSEAQINMHNRMVNNFDYYTIAQQNAEEMIKDLLQSLNPDTELNIEVEFIDLDK